jgi:hypothetical protein
MGMLLGRLGCAAILAATCLSAQPAELKAVEKWRFRFTYTASKTVQTDEADWTYRVTATADFLLDTRRGRTVWYGHPNTQIQFRLSGTSRPGCPITTTVEYSGPATRTEDPDAMLALRPEGYSIDMGNPWVEAKVETRYACTSMIGGVETSPWNWKTIWVDPIPYPQSGTTLSGTLKRSHHVSPIPAMLWAYEPVDAEITYTLTPAGEEDLRLEIETTDEYREWRPSAAPDGGAGRPLALKATVVTTSGKPPSLAVESFFWELAGTSREPGISMNYPAGAQDDRFDLELASDSPFAVVSSDRQRVERIMRGEGFSDTIRVVPFDWGAWGELKVAAVMTDGTRLTGRLKGSSEDVVRLPKRSARSKIADFWKEEKGVRGADDADDEQDPAGDGTPGDGLTLYEEYRGFYEDGRHIDGNPHKKDLFVQNGAGDWWRPGIELFRRVTGLQVHGRLLPQEMPESRIINGNRRQAPRVTDQHAVIIRPDPSIIGYAEAAGGPGNPKMIKAIRVPQQTGSLPAAYWARVLAHELLHAVNVYHHGETETVVTWFESPAGQLVEFASGGAYEGTPIRALKEDGTEVTETLLERFRRLPGGRFKLIRGEMNGLHSGFENCLLRYDTAETYASRSRPGVRYVVTEKVPDSICTTPQGTGVNAQGRRPESRYGDAAPTRGDCQHQILVTDAAVAKSRRLP